jgi:hypothetical protein
MAKIVLPCLLKLNARIFVLNFMYDMHLSGVIILVFRDQKPLRITNYIAQLAVSIQMQRKDRVRSIVDLNSTLTQTKNLTYESILSCKTQA